MESKFTQILSFSLVAVAMGLAAVAGLQLSNEVYFYPLVISRVVLSLTALVLLLLLAEKGKALAEGTSSLLFLAVALSESFFAYLQADLVGPSYMILSVALVLSSALSFLTLGVSLFSMLPSQLTILATPFFSLPKSAWSNRLLITKNLLLPVITLVASSVIWIVNSIYVHRKNVNSKLKTMKRRQELLQAQMLLLKTQPTKKLKPIRLPPVHETIRVRSEEGHSSEKFSSISDQVLLDDVIDSLRGSISSVQSNFSERRPIRMILDLPAPMSLPIAVAAEGVDLKKVLLSALSKSACSLNGDDGVVRISLKVGFKAVAIAIEDNGWGLREKFSSNSELDHELSLREIQAMVKFWGGRFEVLSRLGVGTRMNIELERVDSYIAVAKDTERKSSDDQVTNSTPHSSTRS